MRARAVTFAARWKDETSERGQSQSFWTEFLDIYGVDRKRVALFEQLAKRTSTGNYGFIDLYWPGVLIAEQKSAGKDLEEAEKQALDWPDRTDVGIASVSSAAAEVLTARMAHQGASLADLYGPLSMPPDLTGAHKALDKFVLATYGLKSSATDAEVLSALFARYEELVAPMIGVMGKKRKKGSEPWSSRSLPQWTCASEALARLRSSLSLPPNRSFLASAMTWSL